VPADSFVRVSAIVTTTDWVGAYGGIKLPVHILEELARRLSDGRDHSDRVDGSEKQLHLETSDKKAVRAAVDAFAADLARDAED